MEDELFAKAFCSKLIITKPGTKRVLYTHKDTVWVTFHATDKTTVEDLEKAGELVCDKFDEFDVIVNSEVS